MFVLNNFQNKFSEIFVNMVLSDNGIFALLKDCGCNIVIL